MNEMDIRATFAIIFISCLFVTMGYLIKRFNLAEFAAGYNKDKHERYKDLISKYLGSLLLYNGLLAFTTYLLNLFFKLTSTSMLSYIVFGILFLSSIITIVILNIKIKQKEYK